MDVSLENLIDWQDQMEESGVFSPKVEPEEIDVKKDPLEDNKPDESGKDPNPDPDKGTPEDGTVLDLSKTDLGPGAVPTDPEPSPDDNQTPTPDDSPEITLLTQLAEFPEDFDFEDKEAISTQLSTHYEQVAANNLIGKLPEEYQAAVRFALLEQKPLSEFVKNLNVSDFDVNKVDINSVEDQRAVLSELYRTNSNLSPDRINALVDLSEKQGTLEDDSKTALIEIVEIRDRKVAERNDKLAKAAEKRNLEEANSRKTLKDKIQSLEEDAPRKIKLKNYMTNEVTRSDKLMITDFARTLGQALSNPDHRIQLGNILLDYDAKDGFTLDRWMLKKASTETSKIKQQLDNNVKGSKSVSSPTPPVERTFDWDEWARQAE